MTSHNRAEKGDIADVVIMPGDPKRVEFIKDKYLDNPVLVNDIRYALCYTGTYKGKRISVMASGMGMPSMSIYAYELFKFYGVETIIRVGSCKSKAQDIKLRDIILANEAYTDSNISYSYALEDIHAVKSSELLDQKLMNASQKLGININQGLVWTTDLFYKEKEVEDDYTKRAIGLEMETFALFYMANKLNKNAAAVLTVSDSMFTNNRLTPEEREKSFEDAVLIALESLF